MKLLSVFLGLGLAQCVVGFEYVQPPACVPKCWDNSKYVSSCVRANETLCLCEDAEFQNTVFQCLYSQCPTTQFASALHHSLSVCTGPETEPADTLPPLIRHQSLRKRGVPTAGVNSGHVSASATRSVARRSVSASTVHSTRITRSVAFLPTATPRIVSVAASRTSATSEETGATIVSD